MKQEFEYVFALPNGRYQGHYNRHLLKGNYPPTHPEFKAWLDAGKPVHDIEEFDTIYPPIEAPPAPPMHDVELHEKVKQLEEVIDLMLITLLEDTNV